LETSLYAPVKRFLEGLGFEVKGEVCGCDIVAVDHGSPIALVICELKLSFTLELVLQAADRSTVCDEVWLAVRGSMRGAAANPIPVKRLCRLLGFGLLCVSRSGRVDAWWNRSPGGRGPTRSAVPKSWKSIGGARAIRLPAARRASRS